MLFRQKVFAILAALSLLIIIIEMVRRRKLKEEYSLLWILTGVTILLLTVWYDLLAFLSTLIGAIAHTTTLFISGVMFLILITLHFSVKMSTLTDQVRKLTQELAILRSKLESD